MTDSDFMTRVDRSTKDVAQGYADDEWTGGLVAVPEEVNKYANNILSFDKQNAHAITAMIYFFLIYHGYF